MPRKNERVAPPPAPGLPDIGHRPASRAQMYSEIDDLYEEVVRAWYDTSGRGYGAAARLLNQRGILTRAGCAWTQVTLRDFILRVRARRAGVSPRPRSSLPRQRPPDTTRSPKCHSDRTDELYPSAAPPPSSLDDPF